MGSTASRINSHDPSPRALSARRRLFVALAALILMTTVACAPIVKLVRAPVEHEGRALPLPWLSIYTSPTSVDEQTIGLETPAGSVMLVTGPALREAYTKALDTQFEVFDNPAYSDYFAYANFDRLAVTITWDAEGCGALLTLTHEVVIQTRRGTIKDRIPIRVSTTMESTDGPNLGPEAYARILARATERLIAEAERELARALADHHEPGRYRLHGQV
jgi:hypothetical protein